MERKKYRSHVNKRILRLKVEQKEFWDPMTWYPEGRVGYSVREWVRKGRLIELLTSTNHYFEKSKKVIANLILIGWHKIFQVFEKIYSQKKIMYMRLPLHILPLPSPMSPPPLPVLSVCRCFFSMLIRQLSARD